MHQDIVYKIMNIVHIFVQSYLRYHSTINGLDVLLTSEKRTRLDWRAMTDVEST